MDLPQDTLTARIAHDFAYHAPPDASVATRHEEVRQACHNAAVSLVGLCPSGRELSSALTKLEEAMMHANAAIARHPDLPVASDVGG